MNIAEVIVPQDVPGALHRLHRDGFLLIMVTNQPNIVRGIQSREAVYAINSHLFNLLHLDAVEVCEHDDADNCDCRKPKPGLPLRERPASGLILRRVFL